MPEPTAAASKEPDVLQHLRAVDCNDCNRAAAEIERLRRIEEAARAAWADDSKFYLLVAALREAEEVAEVLNSPSATEPSDA